MAVSWFLIVIAVIVVICLVIASGFVVIYMQDEQDVNAAWFPKIMVMCGITLAFANVLILPFDVTNTEIGGGLDMEVMWSISMISSSIFLLVFLPFAYFYYENEVDDKADTAGCCGLIPKWNSQFCEGVKWSLGFLFCFGLVLLIMYLVIPNAEIPITVHHYAFDAQRFDSFPDLNAEVLQCTSNNNDCVSDHITIKIQVTFPVYTMALLAFLGWFLFVVFAGMGLVALPWDLFNEWRFRPKPIDLSKYIEEKKKMGHRSALLFEAGLAIKEDELRVIGDATLTRKEKRAMTQVFYRFENAVYLLKRDYYHLQLSYKQRGGSNPLVYWFKLLGAVVGASLSLAWILHICLFILPTRPVSPFLNNLLIELTLPGFPLFGVAAFAFYSFWLLLCVIKGNFRFGLRVACCRVFPMEVGKTLMNSFLANTWLILISSIVVVQFCAMAFPIYSRNTQVDLLFGTQIRYLTFFTYFFNNNIFIWVLIGFSFIACIWLFMCPKNEAQRIEQELTDIMNDKKDISRRQLQMVSKK